MIYNVIATQKTTGQVGQLRRNTVKKIGTVYDSPSAARRAIKNAQPHLPDWELTVEKAKPL